MFAGKSRLVNPVLMPMDVLVASHHQVVLAIYVHDYLSQSQPFVALQLTMGIPAQILGKHPFFLKNKKLLQILMQSTF